MDVHGFITHGHTTGTFTRGKFHDVFATKIAPYLNPWPLPRSILILDNAKIHMYEELQDLVLSKGALLFFLPPYSPDLNPIEVGFSLLKRWLMKYGHLAYRGAPELVMATALRECTRNTEATGYGLYRHCGYHASELTIAE
jgi:transposase